MPRSILDTDPQPQKRKFKDPFMLYSNEYIPRNWYDVLEFALYVSMHNPLYTNAATRTISHFITDIVFKKNGDYQERQELKDYLKDQLGLMEAMRQAGLELSIFGNSFAWIYYPFNRFLVDRRRGYKEIDVKSISAYATYNANDLTYSVPDPSPEYDKVPIESRPKIKLEFIDKKSSDRTRIRIRFIDPLRMNLQMNFMSGSVDYIYRFEEKFIADIKAGDKLHQVNETPMEMLIAIKNGQDFKFNKGNIFHFKNPTVSGISNNGWGIPEVITHYSDFHQIQVMRCINEAIGRDFILPIRILSPSQTISGGGGDVMGSANMALWKNSIGNVIAKKRKEPDSIFSLPFPVSYQEVGGNGKALAPVELLEFYNKNALNNMGIAMELMNGSLSVQQVPTALRMFESYYVWIPNMLNKFAKWIAGNVQEYLKQEVFEVELLRPSMADDLEQKHVYLQMVAAGDISRETGYKAFNINDPVGEKERRLKEDAAIEKMTQRQGQELEREMTLGSGDQIVEAIAQSQQPPPQAGGGAPPGGGGGTPMPQQGGGNVTPLDLQEQAQQEAQQLLQMPEGDRRKRMQQIEATNPTLYALVKEFMEKTRAQAASEGRRSVSAQG